MSSSPANPTSRLCSDRLARAVAVRAPRAGFAAAFDFLLQPPLPVAAPPKIEAASLHDANESRK